MRDAALRRALDRIERLYVEPERIDAANLLAGALGPEAAPAPGATTLTEAVAPLLEARLAGAGPGPALDRARAALLDGAVRRLDRFCRAACGPTRRVLETRLRGRTGGIGIRLGRRRGRLRILAVAGGSPAEAMGLVPGDEPVEIDGHTVDPATPVSRVLAALRGGPGTPVALRVRGDRTPRRERRAELTLPSVELRAAPGGVLVVRLRRLTQQSPAELEAALRGRPAFDAWLVDLRGNTGGSMLAAGAIAGRLLDGGTVIEALDGAGRPVPGLRPRIEAAPGGDVQRPVAVLVDRRTGSSAEALAAALARRGRAVLLGQRTVGKRVVQKLYRDPEADLLLKLSVAWLRPAGAPLPAGGLQPDRRLDPAGEPGLHAAAELLRRHGHPGREAFLRALAGEPAP